MKIRNVLFPIWFLWMVPPIVLITLVGNFVIDSMVIIIAYILFRKKYKKERTILNFYKKSILPVWFFGFLSDFIGSIFMFIIMLLFNLTNMSDIVYGVNMNPFNNIYSLIITIIAMIITSLLIYVFNYTISFKASIVDVTLRKKIAISLAIITTPWTFLIPSIWFY